MTYIQHTTATGTSNIHHLLNDWCKAQLLPLDVRVYTGFFNSITQDDLTHWLGEPSIHDCDDDSGYGHEWYYHTPVGKNIGIGFRWGFARVRGDGRVNTDDIIEFLNWVLEHSNE